MWSVAGFFQWLYWSFIGKWLWDLFRHGPASLGCWASAADHDVCARIATGTRSVDWLEYDVFTPTHACTDLIQRSFYSFSVVVHSALYVCAIVCACRALAHVLHQRNFARTLALELRATHCVPVFKNNSVAEPEHNPQSKQHG